MVWAKMSGAPVSVQYKVDGGPAVDMAESAKKKWGAPWNTTGAADDNHSIQVIASDAAGSGGTAVPMSFNAALGFWEALWDTSSLPPGSVTLYFRAADDIGETATVTRTVTVGSTAPTTGEWTHSRGDLQNRAYTAESYGTNFTPLWTVPSAVGSARLVLHNGILYAAYITLLNTAVLAVRPDGSTFWRSAIKGTSAPLVTPDGILVGDGTGKVYALDPRTGEALWSVQTNESIGFMKDYMPVYADGRLYLPGRNSIPVIDVASRQVAFTINRSPWQGLMYDAGLLYVANMYTLTAFDGATGEMKWSFQAPSYIGTPPAAANGVVIVGADEPKLYALNGATGDVLWSQVLDTYGSAYGWPVIAGDVVYTGAYFGGLKAFNLQTGEYLATLLPGVTVRDSAVPAGGVLYVLNTQWGVYALKKQ